ncbi:GNAT family N-acetyltransferase [Klebsiella sp. BIGb0407]|uniref:GNAT family N-acetyltransferase n=1 Tax=Klebsiella sp. BIGb0407 TaxID=2940603 RepID=UPI00216A33DD|nr:GNAT family N-acetyltransferase [Klebsiella sp. BIGb0407]MCS3429790.1 ribosomal protein S18 acetylase RimI-like enzyme [Klebsiella sp. BIGb0407]
MKTLIRPALTTDIQAIFSIRTAVKENHLSLEQLTEMGITPEVILEMLALPDCIWVAEINEITAGFAIADLEEGAIFALFVLPEYEGLGLGKQLMNHAEAALFQQYAQIWLETDSESRAAAFYQRRGWEAVEQLAGTDKRYQKKRP